MELNNDDHDDNESSINRKHIKKYVERYIKRCFHLAAWRCNNMNVISIKRQRQRDKDKDKEGDRDDNNNGHGDNSIK